MCPLGPTFFGLTAEYMESVYEQFFLMKYFGGWSFTEAYSLPVGLRTWFFQRLAKQLKKEQEEADKAKSKAKR